MKSIWRLLIILAFSTTHLYSQMQTMAIPQGTIISFGEALGRTLVNAFCIDRGLDTPSRGADFNSLSGNVRLTFTDGTSKVLDFQQAQSYIQVSGTGSFSSLQITPKTKDVKSLEFLSHSVASRGTAEDARRSQQIIQESFPKELPTKSRTDIRNTQTDIWQRLLWKRTVTGSGLDTVTTLDYKRRDQDQTLSQRFMSLSTTGDSIILSLPNKKTILIDTGYATADVSRITDQLGDREDLAIITHPDRDHSGNFPRLQSAKPFSNVILSGWSSDTLTAQSVTASVSTGYEPEQISEAPMAIYTSHPPNTPPSVTTPPIANFFAHRWFRQAISVKPESFNDDDPQQPFPLSVATVKADNSVKIELYQLATPKTPNEASIAVRVTHNGYSTLYASDITPKVMGLMAFRDLAAQIDEHSVGDIRIALQLLHSQYPDEEAALAKKYGSDVQKWSEDQLSAYEAEVATFLQSHRNDPEFQSALEQLEHEAEQASFSIHADTLKWPHHAWVPRTRSEQEAVVAFVNAVNPQRIIFSVGPQDLPGQSVAEVEAFLRQAIPDRHFEFFTTRDDGSILLLTVLKEALTFETFSHATPAES